jgi:hypothetical protein
MVGRAKTAASIDRLLDSEIRICYTFVTSTMQALDTARRETRGGAPSPPLLHPDTPPLVLVAPPGGDQIGLHRQKFGHRLHAARERSGVSLEEIAHRTKVSTTLLAALERGDASRWPKGLFRRAFFRDYVAAIGLPAEPHITEFLHLFPDGEDHPMAAPDETAGPILRLSLAPQGVWRKAASRLQQEARAAVAVLPIAVAVTMWMDGRLLSLFAFVGLCYSGRVATFAARRLLARSPRLERNQP